jgi:hypothetical protein
LETFPLPPSSQPSGPNNSYQVSAGASQLERNIVRNRLQYPHPRPLNLVVGLKAGQYAQLIFGGYDSSRFVSNAASFTLNEDITRDIVVAIQSITYSGTTQSTLLSTPIFAFIESTDPNIWLPEAACLEFEEAFGLSINKEGRYLINDTHYRNLQAENPEVTFSLSNSLSGGETVNIILPWNAFVLPTAPPFTTNDTYYFPLKKAANDSQITLGRAFLQEA